MEQDHLSARRRNPHLPALQRRCLLQRQLSGRHWLEIRGVDVQHATGAGEEPSASRGHDSGKRPIGRQVQ